jgi:predicted dehydrogenase
MPATGSGYRVGVVGLGGRGRQIAEHWRGVPGAELVAIADLVPERIDQTRELVGDIDAYASHSEMLDNANLDVLTIGTTGQFHAQITRDACARGIKAIYCEKPMANSLADADAMIEVCREHDVILQIGHQRRWLKSINALRNAIKEGAIGLPTHGFVYWPTGRVGSSGTHLFDAINYILDSEPVAVSGRLQRGLDLSRVDEHPVYKTVSHLDPGVYGYITYANGARIAIDGCFDVLLPITYAFAGTRGRIELDELSSRIELETRDSDTRSHNEARRLPLNMRDFPRPEPEANGEPEGKGYREMLACIESGARPASAGEDGRMALEIIVAFHLSDEAGGAEISLPLPADVNVRRKQLTIH